MTKKQIAGFGVLVLLIIVVIFGLLNVHSDSSGSTVSRQSLPAAAAPTFNKKQYSQDNPSIIWVVVNKIRPTTPKTYIPSSLVVPAIPLRLTASSEEMHVSGQMAPALEQLVNAAKKAGINLMLASGYRSYNLQVSVYNSIVASQGQTAADLQSARPGYSEHQTGFAADLEPTSRKCEVEQCFANLPEGKWLAQHAYQYGFIIRYPADKTQVTGYEYEPWHVRYIGVALSNELHKENIETLEEFFGLPAAPTYK